MSVLREPVYEDRPFESSRTGEVARKLAEDRHLDVHELYRGAPGTRGHHYRKELVQKVRALGFAPDGIDRYFGWAVGTSASLLGPRLVAVPPVAVACAPQRPEESKRVAAWKERDAEAEAARKAALSVAAVARHEREREASREERLARMDAQDKARSERESARRQKRAVDPALRAALVAAAKERKLQRALRREERRVASELRKQRNDEAAVRKRVAPVVEVARRIAAALPPKPKVSVMPKCQVERNGEPCGRLALAWTPEGEPACVYCAVQARQTG